jgi:UPF0042 nucleotide-binding protein
VSETVPKILLITGLAGSGKTHVLRALEDAGWFCVDNLPVALIPSFVDLSARSPDGRRAALVVDLREPGFLEKFPAVLRRLRGRGVSVRLLFVEAEPRVLKHRFRETRRPHPLAVNQPVAEGLREEREALRPIRKMADHILDTSGYTVHQLRDYVRERYEARAAEDRRLVVSVTSFGFKYGIPADADLVMDVRFLPNPNFVPALKKRDGRDPSVVRFLKRQKDTGRFLARLEDFLKFLLPRYAKEGKSYLTVAIGCTGGRHRSVMIADEIARRIQAPGLAVSTEHRDVRHA